MKNFICCLYDSNDMLVFSTSSFIHLQKFLERKSLRSTYCLVSRARLGKLKRCFDKSGNGYNIYIEELNYE